MEVLNHALRNVPASALRMHVCWGNYEGPHDHDIPLEKILHIVLKAKPSAILFEASNPRHAHEWTVWRDAKLPEDKVLVPGLLTSTSNYVEHPELVAQRVQQFADIVGRDRVIAGTDCGFGTFAGIGKMDAGISWRKLAALVKARVSRATGCGNVHAPPELPAPRTQITSSTSCRNADRPDSHYSPPRGADLAGVAGMDAPRE